MVVLDVAMVVQATFWVAGAVEVGVDPEDFVEGRPIQDRFGRALGAKSALVEKDGAIGPTQRLERVVCGPENSHPTVGEVSHQGQDAMGLSEVQMGGRLVQQEQLATLRQGAGQKDALAFAAGQFVEGTVGERTCAHLFEGFQRGEPILCAGRSERPQVRDAAERDGVHDAEGERWLLRLRDVGDASGAFPGRKS